MRKGVVAAVCAALCVISAASDAIAGCEEALVQFRGVRWGGLPPEDLGLKFNGSDAVDSPPLPPFGGFPVLEDQYSFNRANRFIGGTIVMSSEYAEGVKGYLIAEFGDPQSSKGQMLGKWQCVSDTLQVVDIELLLFEKDGVVWVGYSN